MIPMEAPAMPQIVDLLPVTTREEVEWLRVQRSRPEVYKYFRQDKRITEKDQSIWWKTLNKSRVRLFLIHADGRLVGYAGFNPLLAGANRAEFGLFVIPEDQGKGIGERALIKLLDYGFGKLHLSCIYSDVLDYPGENRWAFYKKVGFEKHPDNNQNTYYRKQGKTIHSIKFFMLREQWEKLYGEKNKSGLGLKGPQVLNPKP